MRTLAGRGWLQRGENPEDFARPRVTLELRLLEDRLAVVHYLEPSLPRRDQLHVGPGVLLPDFGRQTDGPWLVVSKRAVLDRDGHGSIS